MDTLFSQVRKKWKDTIQMFHDFLDFKHPIFSKIETLEKSDQPLIQILENLKGENIYISLDEEHTKKKIN